VSRDAWAKAQDSRFKASRLLEGRDKAAFEEAMALVRQTLPEAVRTDMSGETAGAEAIWGVGRSTLRPLLKKAFGGTSAGEQGAT